MCPLMMTFMEVKGHQQSNEVNFVLKIMMTFMEFIMMMTVMEVKGHQRSNVIKYVLCVPNLVRRIPDASL